MYIGKYNLIFFLITLKYHPRVSLNPQTHFHTISLTIIVWISSTRTPKKMDELLLYSSISQYSTQLKNALILVAVLLDKLPLFSAKHHKVLHVDIIHKRKRGIKTLPLTYTQRAMMQIMAKDTVPHGPPPCKKHTLFVLLL